MERPAKEEAGEFGKVKGWSGVEIGAASMRDGARLQWNAG